MTPVHSLKSLAIAVAALLPIALIGVGAAGASSTAAAPAAGGHGASASPAGLVHVYKFDPNFRPLHASPQALAAHGYPQRPVGSAALDAWTEAMQSITGPAPLNSVYTTVRHGPPRDAVNSVGADGSGEHTIYYSSNWAGHVVPNSYYGGVSFWYATAVWTQPSVPANSSYPNWQNAPTASFWVGTGVTSLIQAGADSISASTATYKMWDEDYPDPTVYEGPAVRPGDKLFVYSYYNGDSTSTYYMENETTGKISSFVRSSPNVGFRAANFINERLGSLYLPNFGSTAFSSGAFADSNANYYPLTTNNDKYIMEDSAGHIQSSPTGVSNQGFTVTWSHS